MAQALVVLAAAALLLAAWTLDPAWLRHHILPEFFQPRDEQLRDLAIVRAILVAMALLLLWPVRRWFAGFVARRTPGQLAADMLPMLLAVVAAIGASELLLRRLPWFATHELPTQREPLRRRDPVLGWTYAPDRTARGVLGGRSVEYAFDGAGRRVRRQAERLDHEAPSILFVGESIISGHGVTYDESIPARVGASLGLQPVNLAVGGYATDQMYLRLQAEGPKFRAPRALAILFMPSLFHRNLEHDRPHLDPSLAWRPPSDDWRLVQIARRLVPYRSDRDIEDGVAMTRRALGAMVAMAEARGAVPVILVPQLTPETAEEAALRARVLAGLPTLVVPVDPSWRLPNNRHPDARANAKIAAAITAYLAARGVQPASSRPGALQP